uniref:NET domain-containing protein n=1 Tax=viral metagenome TaxID=1070528 RepID=A0A6C0CQ15_9ZZZZ
MSLRELKEEIEKMSKYHQVEVLRLLKKNSSVTLNENQNGTFINLTSCSEEIISSLRDYCKYVNEQQKTLSSIEKEKQRLEEEYFKDIKENSIVSTNV